jgi:putative methionine-R-sulfoxide reductase with GAF domain
MDNLYRDAEIRIMRILKESNNSNILQDIVDILYQLFDKYNWIGIYLIKDKFLILGPWKGRHPTEHNKIPIGKGICGSAAKTGKIELINNVEKDNRYLACFINTKSEIVIPIKKNDIVIGEIDIDSDKKDAFNNKDCEFLEKIADMLIKHIY